MAGSLTSENRVVFTPPTPEPSGAGAGAATVTHARELLAFNQLSVLIALGLGAWFYFGFASSTELVAGCAWLVVFFCLIGLGRRKVNSANTVKVGLWLLLGNWITALVITAVVPFTYPAGILQILIPVIANAPFLGRRALFAVVTGATMLTATVCALGLWLGDTELTSAIGEQTRDRIMIAGLPVMTIAIGIGAWDAHDRQKAQLRRTLAYNDEIRESRKRLVAVADNERNRIERDLHDGAQQHLVALAMQLRLLRSTSGLSEDLDPLIGDLEEAMVSLRELAHGIYPPLLRSRGLAESIAAAARRSPATVDVDVIDQRVDPSVEAGIYFCSVEAIHNAAKHAGPDALVRVVISRSGDDLTAVVSDNGPGFDIRGERSGVGLRNMEDRIVSLGGRFEIRCDDGTEVHFSVPIGDR